jgi:hypothetical protein
MRLIGVTVPALGYHVQDIIDLRSNKQMVGIYTRRNITPMTDNQPFGDGAIGFRPDNAVHRYMLVGDNHLWIAATIYLTIP